MSFGTTSFVRWLVAGLLVSTTGCPAPISPVIDTPDTSIDTFSTVDTTAMLPDEAVLPLPARRFITDRSGRALILHGVNVDNHAKGDPERTPAFTEADAVRFRQKWGFNFVRYLVLWDTLEPMPGQINTAYLDRIATRLDWFARNDITVMLDMHQDVYARRFCCDGAPAWATRDDNLEFIQQPVWFQNYFQPAVVRAFDNFWSYTDPNRDLQDHYGDAWVALAQRFKLHPAVIGYDLMNEPSPGSAFDVSETLRGVGSGTQSRSAQWQRERLATFYQRIAQKIRAVDSDGWIFIEPTYGAAANGAQTYLPVMDDPRTGEDRIVFAPHLYSVMYEAMTAYQTGDRTVARWEDARKEETRTNNWPIVMGEFGMDQTFPGAARYLDDVLDMADRLQVGWAYWSWDPGSWGFWNPQTMTEGGGINAMVRAYPQRVAGIPRNWNWNRTTKIFTLEFDSQPGITGRTEIFVPADRFFPNGITVESSDPTGSWTQQWDSVRQVLSIEASAMITTHRITVH